MGADSSETTSTVVAPSTAADAEIVGRVLAGDAAPFEILMRRHNQRIYRAVRAVVKAEEEIEDIMQQAYMNAFAHLRQFEQRSQFSTWLMRIALNEAFARRRRMQATTSGEATTDALDRLRTPQADPEHQAYASELRRVLESAVDALPDVYRAVFVLRDIEGLTTSETSDGLGIGAEAVKTRLHRARAMIRRTVTAQIGVVASDAFSFPATRCDRVVAAVLDRLLSTPGEKGSGLQP